MNYLADYSLGRVALHLIAIVLSGHFLMHFQGIVREFQRVQTNPAPQGVSGLP